MLGTILFSVRYVSRKLLYCDGEISFYNALYMKRIQTKRHRTHTYTRIYIYIRPSHQRRVSTANNTVYTL